jgi:hypothetical protein
MSAGEDGVRRRERPASKGVDRWRPLGLIGGAPSAAHTLRASGPDSSMRPGVTPCARPSRRAQHPERDLLPPPFSYSPHQAHPAPAQRVRGRGRLVRPGGCPCGALQHWSESGARLLQGLGKKGLCCDFLENILNEPLKFIRR